MAAIKIDSTFQDNLLTVSLGGEIDHHNAGAAREQIDGLIRANRPDIIVLDFAHISFMDSSGIGLIMGRYRIASELGAKLEIANAPRAMKKVMQLAGLQQLVNIR